MKLTKIVKKFRIDKPDKFRLADYDPADTCGVDIDKAEAKAMLANGVIIESGTTEEFTASTNPMVKQFLHGETQGPISVL